MLKNKEETKKIQCIRSTLPFSLRCIILIRNDTLIKNKRKIQVCVCFRFLTRYVRRGNAAILLAQYCIGAKMHCYQL